MTELYRYAPLSTAEDVDYFQKSSSNMSNNTNNSPTREITSQEDSYESCPNCSRKFFAGRLKLHLKSCRDGKPQAKSVKTTKSIVEKSTDDSLEQPGNRMTSLGSETIQGKIVNSHNRTSSVPHHDNSNEAHQPEQNMATAESEEVDNRERQKAEDGRVGCFSCGRFFHEDRVGKHEKACRKSNKKRPVFDTTQQRAIVELGTVPKKSSPEPVKTKKVVQKEKVVVEVQKKEVQGGKEETNKKIPAWKAQHENFIENIRFNRKIKEMQARGEDTSQLVVPTIVNDTYVSCSYCFRKFAPATAERHIPKCKNTFNRPKPPKNLNLEDIERADRSKSQISPKKGTTIRKVQESDYKEPVTPTKSIGKEKMGSNRSPTQEQQSDEKSQPNDSPKSSTKLPQFSSLKADSRAFMKKVPSLENSRKNVVLPGIRNVENNLTAFDISMSKNSREMRSQSPPGGKKIFTEPMRRKDELLQHYQSLLNRACTYATEACPYCLRKFSHHAAERHIPVCKSLPRRNMRKNAAGEEVIEVMSAEKKRPKKMYFTGFNPKMMFTKGDDDTIFPKSSHNGNHSTDHFFGEKRVKKNERRPLPLVKSQMESKDAIIEKFEKVPLLQKPKFFSSAAHFCTSCGSRLAKIHNFCGNCGSRKEEL